MEAGDILMFLASLALVAAVSWLSIRFVTIPRSNPVNAFTMGRIVEDAGLTEQEFRGLL